MKPAVAVAASFAVTVVVLGGAAFGISSAINTTDGNPAEPSKVQVAQSTQTPPPGLPNLDSGDSEPATTAQQELNSPKQGDTPLSEPEAATTPTTGHSSSASSPSEGTPAATAQSQPASTPAAPKATTAPTPLTPMEKCQEAIKKNPPYALDDPQWKVSCVNRLHGKIGLATDSSFHRGKKTITLQVKPNSEIEDYAYWLAFWWAKAEAASWGQDGYAFNTQWLRIIGHTPVEHKQYWPDQGIQMKFKDRPSNIWADTRAQCAGYAKSTEKKPYCKPLDQQRLDSFNKFVKEYKDNKT